MFKVKFVSLLQIIRANKSYIALDAGNSMPRGEDAAMFKQYLYER